MVFEIQGKVALVTGGASGIGFQHVKEFLRNGIRGVVIADWNADLAKKALKELQDEFGESRVIFIHTDISNYRQFEEAFRKTIEKFQNVDILINNAGVVDDNCWEKEIAVNVNGTIHGMLLGIEEYLPKYKQGHEALIVNICSVAGIHPYGAMPVYCTTKHALVGATRTWGIPFIYEKTNVRVIGVCPGFTSTPVAVDLEKKVWGGKYRECLVNTIDTCPIQEPQFVAKEVMELIRKAPPGSVWVVEDSKPAYEYIFPDTSTMTENVLGN